MHKQVTKQDIIKKKKTNKTEPVHYLINERFIKMQYIIHLIESRLFLFTSPAYIIIMLFVCNCSLFY